MNSKIKIWSIVFALLIIMFSCGHNNKLDFESSSITIDDSNQIQVGYDEVKKKEKINLSDIVESLEVVKMDNSQDALFTKQWIYFSDNFIAVSDGSQDKRPAKLFDRNGRFIGTIGGIGRGPGEYTSVYNILIDENTNSIYVTEISSNVVHQYDLNGKFIKDIKLDARLNKGRLFNNCDSTISIVNLCFNDRKDGILAATVNPFTEEKSLFICPELGTSFEGANGAGIGFDNEVFSYRNTSDNTFEYSYLNKLLRYDPTSGNVSSILEFTLPENMREDHWLVFNELPNDILVHIVGTKGKTIKVSKQDGSAVEVEMVNDFLGGMDTGMSFQDGYYFLIYEPRYLMDKVSEFIKINDVDAKSKEYLLQLINSMKEDDNNIVFLGKLRL